MEEKDKVTEKKSIWQRITEFNLRHRLSILILIGLGTVFFSYVLVAKVSITADFFELYPPRHAHIKLYKQYQKMFGTANMVSIVVEVKEGEVYDGETLGKVERITKELIALDGVNAAQVNSLTHPKLKEMRLGNQRVYIDPFIRELPKTEEESKIIKDRVYSNVGILGRFVSADNKSLLITAGVWEQGVDLGKFYEQMMELKAREDGPNHTLYITGYPMLYAWIAHYASNLYLYFIFTFLILIGLLTYYFRTFIGVIVPIISGLLSAIWGLGFAGVLGYNIDPLILVVPMLLSARAVSHSVQCLERYHDDYLLYNDKEKAIVKSYTHLFKPALVSIITDGLGVLTIVICTIPLMQKLGLIGSFWIISIYVSVITLNPILVTLFPAPGRKKESSQENVKRVEDVQASIREIEADAKEMVKLSELKRPGGRVYLAICNFFIFFAFSWRKWAVTAFVIVFIIVGGLVASFKLKIGDTNAGKAILHNLHPYNIALDKVNKDFIGSSQMIVIAEGKSTGAMLEPESIKLLEKLQLHSSQMSPHVGGVVTVIDSVKAMYRMLRGGDPKWSILPKTRDHLSLMFGSSGFRSGDMAQLISTPDCTNATVTIFFRHYDNQIISDAILDLKKFIKKHPSEQLTFRLAGGILGILAAMNEAVEYSYRISMVAIFSLTYVLCVITYRSFIAGFILIIPLAFSQVLCDFFMLYKGIDLNINSLPVAALGVGVGVDYGLYILSRLAEEYQLRGDYKASVYAAITTTGKAVIFTATALICGIFLWIFSDIKFQSEMGMLLCFLMFFNMVGALLFIPAIVSIVGPERSIGHYKVN